MILGILAIIILMNVFILYKLIYFPYPEFFVYPYLANNGLVPYKQIFDQHFPGLMFLPINFDNLGMQGPESARIWSAGIIIAIHLLIFFITSKILGSKRKAILANAFFLAWQPFLEGWVLWIDSFLPLFLLPAFYFVYKVIDKKYLRKDLVLAGIFFGMAILFKQVTIPLVLLVCGLIFWYTKRLKNLIYFFVGLLPIPALMVIYFLSVGSFADFWYWTVWFNVTTFAKYGRKLPDLSGLLKVIFIFSPICLLDKDKERKLGVTLFVFTVGSLAAALSRFDFVHFQPALPFVAISFAVVFWRFIKKGWFKFLVALYVILTFNLLFMFYRVQTGDRVLFYEEQTYEVAEKIKGFTAEKQEIFIFGASPHLYQMTNTIPAGRIFVFQFPWFIMESEERIVYALENNPPQLVVADRTVEIEGAKITNYAKKINEFITENYTIVDRIDKIEFLIRKEFNAKINDEKIKSWF